MDKIVKTISPWVRPGINFKEGSMDFRLDIDTDMLNTQFRKVCNAYDLSYVDVMGAKRPEVYAFVRQLFFYYVFNRYKISKMRLGKWMGNRDHTTVIHAIITIQNRMDTDCVVPPKLHTKCKTTREEYQKLLTLLTF